VVCGAAETERQRAARCRANGVVLGSEAAATLPGVVAEFLAVPTRVAYRVLVWVKTKAVPGDGPLRSKGFFGSSRDMSEVGARIEASAGLSEGDVVQCGFFLPGGNAVEATAKVVRIAAGGGDAVQYGVRWIELSSPDRDSIKRFVDRSARRPPAGA
jgi:hypothetical protein